MIKRACIPVTALWVSFLTSVAPLMAVDTTEKVRVYILAGQSNMEGKAKMELLDYQVEAPETREFFQHLRRDGEYIVREDVWINFLDRRGPLTVGFGSPNCIGPELEFGLKMGNHFDEQVLLIKTAWGGKSLHRDFRPPSSGLPPEETLRQILKRTNENQRKRNRPEITLEEVKASYGRFYREMLREVRQTLDELQERFPGYQGQGYRISGLVWFQGWNDMFDEDGLENYGRHMANFIRDVRRDLGVPDLPVVIGQMGQGGPKTQNEKMNRIKSAQAAMETIPEFRDNVRVVRTDQFWDEKVAEMVKTWRENVEEWKKVGSDYPYHYLGSAKIFCRIGRAFGEAMLALQRQED